MENLLEINGWISVLIALICVGAYYYFGQLINLVSKSLGVSTGNIRQLVNTIGIVLFNLLLLWGFGFKIIDLVLFKNLHIGIWWLSGGIVLGLLVAALTYQTIKGGSMGENYAKMAKDSPHFMLINLLIFVGPAEDLLFLGVLQTILTRQIGFWAILGYILIFSFYHYINVLKGVESNQEFFGMLPIRLVISIILASAYYFTGTLIYSMIIHNLFDTFTYLAVILAVRQQTQAKNQQISG